MSNLARTALATLITLGAFAGTAPARAADLGQATADLLTALYQDTRQSCGDGTQPALNCSGVMIRATTPSMAYAFYSISPPAAAKGGVSISYLRKDARFGNMAFDMSSGFIFDNSAGTFDFKPLCAFPIDAWSGGRNQNGCGDLGGTAIVEKYCDEVGIVTAEQWIAQYQAGGRDHRTQCAFNLRNGKPDRANAFYQMIRATGQLGDEPYSGKMFVNAIANENEVVLAPWVVNVPGSPPVLSSFYVRDAGIEGARLDQIQWYRETKKVLPAIRVTLPRSATQDVLFTYEAARQAILPITEENACPSYVQSARWVDRYDPGFKKNIVSLEVVPTDCGRRIPDSQINNFFNELVAGYYLQKQWVNNWDNGTDKIPSMRGQLTCIMTLARAKASWFLEPARPYTSQDKLLAAGCNNVTS